MKNNISRFALSILFTLLISFVLVAQQAQIPHDAGVNKKSFGLKVRNQSFTSSKGNFDTSSSRLSNSLRYNKLLSLNKNGTVLSKISKLNNVQAANDSWQSYPIYGGEMTSIAVDNTNAQIVYVGTRDAGVYKSTDGAQTWKPSRTGLSFYPIRVLQMDPQNSNKLYAGTDYDGIWKSTDAGNSWIKCFDERMIASIIVIDSLNTNILYVGLNDIGGGRIGKSEDGGATWVEKDSGIPWSLIGGPNYIQDLALGAPGSGIVFAGLSRSGIWESTNGGDIWQDMNNGVPFISDSLGDREKVKAIAADPHHSYRPCAIIDSASFGNNFFIYDGLKWQRMGEVNASFVGCDHLYFHPTSSSIIYDVGESAFNISTDGGNTWSSKSLPWAVKVSNISPSGSASSASSPNTVYIASASQNGNDDLGGVFKSTDEGDKWSFSSQGINATTIQNVTIDPQNSNNIYAGDGDNSFFRTQDGGKTWTTTYPYENPHQIIVDPLNSAIIYMASGSGFFYSTDQGASFSKKIIDSEYSVGCFAIVPDTPRTIYVGGDYYGNCVTKSSDGGVSWKHMSAGIPQNLGGPAPIFSFAVDPFDHHTVWATTQTDSVRSLLKTTDQGEHWNLVHIDDGSFGYTSSMIIKPDNNKILLVGGTSVFGDRIFKTTDGGNTWQMKLDSITVTSFVTDPRNSNVVYASSEGSGVIRSIDFGETWEDYSTGIFYPNLYSIAISHDASPVLVAGSYGSGLYWINPPNVVTGVSGGQTASIPKELHLEQNYPNPFNPSTTISFILPAKASVSLKVFDILGREVATLVNEQKPAGTYTQQWNAVNMASGIYFYRLQAGPFVETKKLILLK